MRIAIIGNSGSGKTTLARRLSKINGARLHELDSIYWEPGKIAEKRDSLKDHVKYFEEFNGAKLEVVNFGASGDAP